MATQVCMQPGLRFFTFEDAAIAPGAGLEVGVPARAGALTWQTYFTVNPGAIVVDLQYSIDGIHWDTIDASTVVGGEVRTFAGLGGAPGFLRGNVVSNTGGSGFNMVLVWTVY